MRNSMRPKLFNRAATAITVFSTVFALAAQNSPLSVTVAKDIYRDGAAGSGNSGANNRSAIAFDVLLRHNGNWVSVGPQYEFHSGDQFRFRVKSNRQGYIYLLNRTFNGDPEMLAAKGIDRVRVEDRQRRPESPTYRLLYPLKGDKNTVSADQWITLPGSDSFNMDSRPGVEKLYVIVSAHPLNLAQHFSLETGQIRSSSSASSSGRRNDSDDDVLGQLNKELETYAANGQTAAVSEKGIIRSGQSESYGVLRDSGKPAQFEVSLKHLAR